MHVVSGIRRYRRGMRQPSLDCGRILALAQLHFIERAEVVHLLGPPGTGKSHLATALGVVTVKAGKRVYRATLAEIFDALSRAERDGRLPEKLRFFSRNSLLIVEEIGYLPIRECGYTPSPDANRPLWAAPRLPLGGHDRLLGAAPDRRCA